MVIEAQNGHQDPTHLQVEIKDKIPRWSEIICNKIHQKLLTGIHVVFHQTGVYYVSYQSMAHPKIVFNARLSTGANRERPVYEIS